MEGPAEVIAATKKITTGEPVQKESRLNGMSLDSIRDQNGVIDSQQDTTLEFQKKEAKLVRLTESHFR